jgi:hypothetical protein
VRPKIGVWDKGNENILAAFEQIMIGGQSRVGESIQVNVKVEYP